MSSDLAIDPNDPLSLLHSSMDDSSSSESGGPQDWSQLSSLWDGSDPSKAYPDLMDFSELNSLPMDMDFNPALGMEPGALHYNPMHFAGTFEDAAFHNVSAEMIPPQFAFTFQQALMNAGANSFPSSSSSSSLSSPETNNKERRLSVASSSSSSGASLSPVLESLASPSSSYGSAPSPSPIKAEASKVAANPAAELAERVRQSAGVMLAVPMSADLSSQVLAHSIAAANSSNRLAIPQHQHQQPHTPISSSSSAASTPPPTTPPMPTSLTSKLNLGKPISSSSSDASSSLATPPASAGIPQPPPGVGASGRPKTSHTTIERRYRTNLNARIQSLRMAVPALRVLEDRVDGSNGKKIKKNLKDGVYMKGAGIGIEAEDGTSVDVIDERGFVDGVKVARKCSKANVLGKAVEYIRVLKKREIRLKAEQDGLKALISGLVGGPALLKDWEIRWRENFGGEERDEVEGEEEMDDSDDEDGEDDEEAAVGKKRKRAKTTAPATKKTAATAKAAPAQAPSSVLAELAPGTGGPAPEKRKRGRPRKVVPPPMPVATLAPHVSHQQAAAMAHQQQHQQQPVHPEQMMHHPGPQAPQYMMAVFALFSFFNSPLTSSYTSQGPAHGHTGMVLTPPLALAPEIVSSLVPPPTESLSSSFLAISGWKDYLQVVHLAVSVLVLASFLWSWLGFAIRKRKEAVTTPTVETPIDGKVNWTAVADDTVLQGKSNSLSTLSLARAYLSLSSTKTATVSQLTSLSLLLSNNVSGPLGFAARVKAHSLWTSAQTRSTLICTPRSIKPPVKVFEKLVLESFETVEQASKALMDASPKEKSNGEKALTPIEVLGALVVKQRVKQHLGALFVEVVSLSQDEIVEQDKDESVKDVEGEMRRTIEAARELGGVIEELGCTLERVWKSSSPAVLDDLNLSSSDETEGGVDGEIQSLLVALVLYKKMFSGTNTPTVTSLLISPPPSPTTTTSSAAASGKTKEGEALLELRKALGSRVFEDAEGESGGCMEDARDKVVDLIVDTERRGKMGFL